MLGRGRRLRGEGGRKGCACYQKCGGEAIGHGVELLTKRISIAFFLITDAIPQRRANEIAAISEAIMGVTVLAWGNSVGDLFADVSISRAGAPSMAVAAVFAGPLFNLLVGMGCALLIATSMRKASPTKKGKTLRLQPMATHPMPLRTFGRVRATKYHALRVAATQPHIPALQFPTVVIVNTGILAASLVLSLVLFALAQFRLTRLHGLIKLLMYCGFMAYNIYAAVTDAPSGCDY